MLLCAELVVKCTCIPDYTNVAGEIIDYRKPVGLLRTGNLLNFPVISGILSNYFCLIVG